MTFLKYERYKNSGVEWLGEIPEHWEIKKAKWIFKQVKRIPTRNDEVVTCFRDGQVTLRRNRRTEGFTNALQEHGYQGIRKGDLVIHAMDAFAGAIGVSDSDGKSTPVYSVCLPWQKSEVNSYFYAYLLRYIALSGFILSLAKGIRERSTDFRFKDFAELLLPSLPIAEQERIAEFLDRKCGEIDEAIAKKQRLIELLDEQKTILINQAVTKGLNPDAPMKDSAIDWLGEIPAHWETTVVKRVAKVGYKNFVDGDWVESPFIQDLGIRLIQTGNVGIGEYKEKGYRYISEETFGILKCTEIFPGNVLICRLDGPVGRACLVPNLGVRMITSVDNTILKASRDFDSKFIVYLMSSSLWLEWIQALCRAGGGFRFRISRSLLGELKIPTPPTKEQYEISKMLDKKLENIKINKQILLQGIAKLEELKQVLIAEAVTGKIKV